MNNTQSPISPYNTPQSVGTPTENQAPVLSLGQWVITLIVMSLPFINLIMMFVWGFSSKTNPNKANFCKAYLILIGIMLAVYVLFIMLFGLTALSSSS